MAGTEAALFYYSGHGIQLRGVNYLLPKDVRFDHDRNTLTLEAITLQDILDIMKESAAIKLAFLDACRDNPYADDLQRSMAKLQRSASVPRGLAPMHIGDGELNTALVFAALPGKTAADGSGSDSPFTQAILKNIRTPGATLDDLLNDVTSDVSGATNGEQIPERVSRMKTRFVFNPRPRARFGSRQAGPGTGCSHRPLPVRKSTAGVLFEGTSMIRVLVWVAFGLFAVAAHAGDCAKLNSGDSFKELSAILECQEQRLKALEQSRGVTGVTASVAADGIWKRGKCFPYEQTQPFKATITIEDTKEELVLCWRDGIAIAKIDKINNRTIAILDPAGYYIQNSVPYQGCEYNKTCTLKLDNGKVNFTAQMLVVPGTSQHVRLTVESRPN